MPGTSGDPAEVAGAVPEGISSASAAGATIGGLTSGMSVDLPSGTASDMASDLASGVAGRVAAALEQGGGVVRRTVEAVGKSSFPKTDLDLGSGLGLRLDFAVRGPFHFLDPNSQASVGTVKLAVEESSERSKGLQ
eukprot:784640-Prorocentrum_minimum.AAC.3